MVFFTFLLIFFGANFLESQGQCVINSLFVHMLTQVTSIILLYLVLYIIGIMCIPHIPLLPFKLAVVSLCMYSKVLIKKSNTLYEPAPPKWKCFLHLYSGVQKFISVWARMKPWCHHWECAWSTLVTGTSTPLSALKAILHFYLDSLENGGRRQLDPGCHIQCR